MLRAYNYSDAESGWDNKRVELDFVFMGNSLLLDASHTIVMSQFHTGIHE